MKKALLFISLAIAITAINMVNAQTYDPYAVQVINNLIANNGLQATPDAPETWTFAIWNEETPKQIISFHYPFFYTDPKLYGVASFAGLVTLQFLRIRNNEFTELDITDCTELQTLNCESNKLSALDIKDCKKLRNLYCSGNFLDILDVTNCIQLSSLLCEANKLNKLNLSNCTLLWELSCGNNKLSELNITNCTQLHRVLCSKNYLTKIDLTGLNQIETFYAPDQSVSLILYENEKSEYILPISLNNPSFGNSAISYSDGMLKSNDKTVTSTSFRVTTGEYYDKLNGTMYFNYSNIGINEIDSEGLRVYPNPATEELIINNYELRIIDVYIYDVYGKMQKAESGKWKAESIVIDISHLQAGVYFVKVLTEQGEITKKIVKQ